MLSIIQMLIKKIELFIYNNHSNKPLLANTFNNEPINIKAS